MYRKEYRSEEVKGVNTNEGDFISFRAYINICDESAC